MYNHGHKVINKMFNLHRHILKGHTYLKDMIPEKPYMTFRRQKNLKNALAPSNNKKRIKQQKA